MASIRIRTGAGGDAVSRSSIPAGRKSRSAALASCRRCLAQTAPALCQAQVVGLRLLGLVDFGKPKRACRRSRNRHRLLNGRLHRRRRLEVRRLPVGGADCRLSRHQPVYHRGMVSRRRRRPLGKPDQWRANQHTGADSGDQPEGDSRHPIQCTEQNADRVGPQSRFSAGVPGRSSPPHRPRPLPSTDPTTTERHRQHRHRRWVFQMVTRADRRWSELRQ